MTTNDSTAGLTRKQLRELRAAQEAAERAQENAVAEVAAEVTEAVAETPAPVTDAATAIPIVRPALAQADVPAPPTPVSGIVMHSAPIVRGPIAREAPQAAGVAQHTQAAPVAEEADASEANPPTLTGRRALRQSRTGAVAEQPAAPAAVEAPTVALPQQPAEPEVPAVAEHAPSRSSRRASRAAGPAAPLEGEEPALPVAQEAPEAPVAPLLHTEPPVVDGVDPAAPVHAEGLFATGDDADVEPLVEGVAASPSWNAPAKELAFDDIIAARPRGTSTSASPTTLIFNPGDMNSALTGPIPSTGELLVTASHPIAPGVASRGHADGAVDDGGTDSVLLDRELPVASSPTPIAAKSAISRSTAGPELVRPAEPEKTNKLTIALVVTGGLLLVAALTTLIVGLMNGALS